jgi:hypothetical protein
MRTRPHVKGFCLTEWTDVPHELNGLVSLRREPKNDAVGAIAPALAEVAVIAMLDRFTYSPGERADVRVVVSNWSRDALPSGEISIALGERHARVNVPAVAAGAVSEEQTVTLEIPSPGTHELLVSTHGYVSSYPVTVHQSPAPGSLDVHGRPELSDALRAAEWSVGTEGLLVAEGSLDETDAALLEREAESGRTIIVLAQNSSVPLFGALEAIPQWWGPSPFTFTTTSIGGLSPDLVLVHEIFHCFPEHFLPEERGPVEVLIPPPTARTGALVAGRAHGRGRIVVCQLPIEEGLLRRGSWELSLLADLVSFAEGL